MFTDLEHLKEHPIEMVEGSQYHVEATFYVQHDIVAGLRYAQRTTKNLLRGKICVFFVCFGSACSLRKLLNCLNSTNFSRRQSDAGQLRTKIRTLRLEVRGRGGTVGYDVPRPIHHHVDLHRWRQTGPPQIQVVHQDCEALLRVSCCAPRNPSLLPPTALFNQAAFYHHATRFPYSRCSFFYCKWRLQNADVTVPMCVCSNIGYFHPPSSCHPFPPRHPLPSRNERICSFTTRLVLLFFLVNWSRAPRGFGSFSYPKRHSDPMNWVGRWCSVRLEVIPALFSIRGAAWLVLGWVYAWYVPFRATDGMRKGSVDVVLLFKVLCYSRLRYSLVCSIPATILLEKEGVMRRWYVRKPTHVSRLNASAVDYSAYNKLVRGRLL